MHHLPIRGLLSSLVRSMTLLTLLPLLLLCLIMPPRLALSAATNRLTPYLPQIPLLLLSENDQGSLLVNPDNTSPVFAYYLTNDGLIEYIGERNTEGGIEKATGMRVTTDEAEILLMYTDDNKILVTVTPGDDTPYTFTIDKPENKKKITRKIFDAITKAKCYKEQFFDKYPILDIPQYSKVAGEIETFECNETIPDSQKNNYHVIYNKGHNYKSRRFFNHEEVRVTTDPNAWNYAFTYPSDEWPFYSDWPKKCIDIDLSEEIILEITTDLALTIIFLYTAPAILSVAAPALVAKYGLETIKLILKNAHKIVKNAKNGLDISELIFGSCQEMADEGQLRCLKNGSLTQQEKKFWQSIVIFKLRIQHKAKTSHEASSLLTAHKLNRDPQLETLKVNFPQPENGTAIPPGTYAGIGKFQPPFDCEASLTISVNQDGIITRFHSDYCEKGNYSAPPYTWEMTPDFGPPENHKLTVTSYNLPAQTGIEGYIESSCASQYQASIAPSGNHSTKMNFEYFRDTSTLNVDWKDFGNSFSGTAR